MENQIWWERWISNQHLICFTIVIGVIIAIIFARRTINIFTVFLQQHVQSIQVQITEYYFINKPSSTKKHSQSDFTQETGKVVSQTSGHKDFDEDRYEDAKDGKSETIEMTYIGKNPPMLTAAAPQLMSSYPDLVKAEEFKTRLHKPVENPDKAMVRNDPDVLNQETKAYHDLMKSFENKKKSAISDLNTLPQTFSVSNCTLYVNKELQDLQYCKDNDTEKIALQLYGKKVIEKIASFMMDEGFPMTKHEDKPFQVAGKAWSSTYPDLTSLMKKDEFPLATDENSLHEEKIFISSPDETKTESVPDGEDSIERSNRTEDQPRFRIVDVRQLLHEMGLLDTQSMKEFCVSSVTGKYAFFIPKEGCIVTSAYCIIVCPPSAVEEGIDVVMEPEYYGESTCPGHVPITPHVKFSSKSPLRFKKDVIVGLYTSYQAADIKKPVEVQIMRTNDEEIDYRFARASLTVERFITFTCREFCGFCGCTDKRQCQELERRYYSAVYVSEEATPTSQILHWMLYEDMPDTKHDNMTFMVGRNVIAGPECHIVRHGYKLLPRFTDCQYFDFGLQQLTVKLDHRFGKKVDLKRPIMMILRGEEPVRHVDIGFKLMRFHDATQTTTPPDDNVPCYVAWKYEKRTKIYQDVHHGGVGIRNDIKMPHAPQSLDVEDLGLQNEENQ